MYNITLNITQYSADHYAATYHASTVIHENNAVASNVNISLHLSKVKGGATLPLSNVVTDYKGTTIFQVDYNVDVDVYYRLSAEIVRCENINKTSCHEFLITQ